MVPTGDVQSVLKVKVNSLISSSTNLSDFAYFPVLYMLSPILDYERITVRTCVVLMGDGQMIIIMPGRSLQVGHASRASMNRLQLCLSNSSV